jgi:ribulose kinase
MATSKRNQEIHDAAFPKPTPGPWGYPGSQFAVGHGLDHLGRYHAIGTPAGDLQIIGATDATARLIAAAPDLLQAAKNMLIQLRSEFGDHFEATALEAAVAKAEGSAA